MRKRKFVIECIDHHTGSIKFDRIFQVEDELSLCEIISPEDSEIFENEIYEISEEEIYKLCNFLGTNLTKKYGAGDQMLLRVARDLDELNYKVHTNRELILMLNGSKPLSTFVEPYPNPTGHTIIPEKFFDPYVFAGTLIKTEYIDITYPSRLARVVLYAKKSEAWRIEANILLRKTAAYFGWNETFEIMEGALLGYEPLETKEYIEKIYRPRLAQRSR